ALAASIAAAISSGPLTPKTKSSTPRERAACCSLKVVRRRGPGIGHRRDPARAGRRLDENVLAVSVELGRQDTDAGDVAAGAGERCHEALSDHIFGHPDDRDSAR